MKRFIAYSCILLTYASLIHCADDHRQRKRPRTSREIRTARTVDSRLFFSALWGIYVREEILQQQHDIMVRQATTIAELERQQEDRDQRN